MGKDMNTWKPKTRRQSDAATTAPCAPRFRDDLRLNIALNWWFYLRPGAYVKNP